jgi:nucleotide-binding universal stress UspA family protein
MDWDQAVAAGRGKHSIALRKENFKMTLAAIMVGVEFDPASKARIKLAAELAARFKSLLIGVAGWPLLKPDFGNLAEAELAGARSAEWVSKELKNLGETFRNIAAEITDRIEWRASMGFPREVIAGEARAADLLVIGQSMLPGDFAHTYDPGTIILAAGRPVLVVPPQIDHLECSKILIAWKDTREARRAVHDALPLLQQAKEVAIAVVHPKTAETSDAEIADIVQYLARHDVSVTQQIANVSNEGEGNILLQLAEEHRVDLIVAGAYGRTRLGEWIFGGVTSDLLRKSRIPCLFSN